jgi:hypothetical protein
MKSIYGYKLLHAPEFLFVAKGLAAVKEIIVMTRAIRSRYVRRLRKTEKVFHLREKFATLNLADKLGIVHQVFDGGFSAPQKVKDGFEGAGQALQNVP